MPPSRFPSGLRYLKPVMDQLAKLPPEELNEDTDMCLVEAALRERIEGLSVDDAQELLDTDCEALTAWLDQSGKEQPAGHFIRGVLLCPDLAESLFEGPPKPLPPAYRIVVGNPSGLPVEDGGHFLSIRDGRVLISISPIDRSTFEHLTATFDAVAARPPPDPSGTFSPRESVALGDNRGVKYVAIGSGARRLKKVIYLLKVPGGLVHVQISRVGGLFEGAKYAEILKSIRIEH